MTFPHHQAAKPGRPPVTPLALAPFHLNTAQNFAYMRVSGTPHSWPDAQAAWDSGRMNAWPKAKQNHSMGYFKEGELPFAVRHGPCFYPVWCRTPSTAS